MNLQVIRQIKAALSNLQPEEVRRTAERPLAIGLIAAGSAGYAAMEDFLMPPGLSDEKRMELLQQLHRAGEPGAPAQFDLIFYEHHLPRVPGGIAFYEALPGRTIRAVLDQREELGLPLARSFPPFRRPVIDHVIQTISRENALFALATALPNVIPSLVQIPWAVGEFASDTAILTMNQIRMAFLVAAASDSPIGFREEKAEIASIIAGAFGWRALARGLVGKVPFGGGLIAKGAVAYAGTYVIGLGLERIYRFGYGLTREEKREAYEGALSDGRNVTEKILASFRKVDAA
ncbi:MAG: hypothetical protein IPM24_02370 [Bryobacterales bacterium]|nr:hypothetical protein [Bryobacterales bacterium]